MPVSLLHVWPHYAQEVLALDTYSNPVVLNPTAVTAA